LLTKHKFDNLPEETLSRFAYNQRNQIANHQLGLISGSSYLQTCDYSYLDNGWLAAINNSMSSTDLFALRLRYDSKSTGSSAETQNNGNIAEVESEVKGRDPILQGFRYDNYNRLTNSYSYDINSSNQLINANDFQTIYDHDARGNLESVYRKGRYPGGSTFSSGVIDDLAYTPQSNSNKILSIADNAPTATKRYGLQGSSTNFSYDNDGSNTGNGTLTYDGTLEASIEYNHLNLPRRITFDHGGLIEFTYDAEGNQLRKVVTQGEVLEDRYYIDGLEYKNDDQTLVQIMHDEGRIARSEPCDQNQFLSGIQDNTDTYYGDNIISNTSVVPVGTTTYKADQSIVLNEDFHVETGKVYEAFIEPCTPGPWQYEYTLNDHLGNTRVVFTDGNEVLQEQHYYPFGMSLSGVWNDTEKQDYAYKYNHKELHRDFDLNWSSYGARCYSSSLNSFPTPDRFCEKYPNLSPYQYGANDPIKFIDVNGDSIKIIIDKSNSVYYDNGKIYNADGSEYTGKGTKVKKNGNRVLTGDLKKVVNALDKISNGGSAGKELIEESVMNRKTINISVGKNNSALGLNVSYNPQDKTGGLDANGSTIRPAFLGLAHELVHAIEFAQKTIDYSNWFSYKSTGGRVARVRKAEISASNFENRIRAENGITLRSYYTVSEYAPAALLKGTNSLYPTNTFGRNAALLPTRAILPVTSIK